MVDRLGNILICPDGHKGLREEPAMPAKIIQTNRKPFQARSVEPITLDIIENALRNARTEMDAVLFRTAMSPGIREQHDAFPMIANLEGKMVVGQFGSFIHGFMQGYDGTIEEGDIFLTNDPYSCNGAISHLNDWLLMMPIFRDGRLVAWAAMFGHMTDVGGKVPGSLPTDAPHDLRGRHPVPPIKIFRGGTLQDEVLNLMLHNCRLPTLEPLRLQRHRRGAAPRRAARASRSATASATTCSTPRWRTCSTATSARCAS